MPCRQSLGARAARAARGAGDETRQDFQWFSPERICWGFLLFSCSSCRNINKLNCNDGFAVHQPAPPAKATKTLRIAKQSCHKFDARPGFKTRIELACPCHHMSSSGQHRMTLLSLLHLLLRNLPILSHSHWPYHWNRAAPPIAPGSVGLLGNESDWGKQNRSKVGLVGKQIDLEEFGKSLDYAELGTASNVGSAFGCWSETAPLQVFSRNLSKHQRQYSTHHHHFEMLRVFPFPACSLVATMVKGEALFGVEASQLRRRSSEELFLTNFWSCQSISYRKSMAYRKVFEMQKQWSAEVMKLWIVVRCINEWRNGWDQWINQKLLSYSPSGK